MIVLLYIVKLSQLIQWRSYIIQSILYGQEHFHHCVSMINQYIYLNDR